MQPSDIRNQHIRNSSNETFGWADFSRLWNSIVMTTNSQMKATAAADAAD